MIKVLITGGGAPGIAGTIFALRSFFGKEVKIVVADARDDVPGKYMSDAFYTIPKANSPMFLSSIEEIIKKEKINVILPQVTRELPVFSSSKDRLESLGVKVIVQNMETLEKANNKFELLKTAEKIGYRQGKYRLVRSKEELISFSEEIGYPSKPFVVKLPTSNGMRGLRIITHRKLSLESFINEKPRGEYATLEEVLGLFDMGRLEVLAMEYYPGKEYTIDVYRSPISKKVIAIPRTRDVIRTGITFEGTIEKNERLIKISEALSKILDLQYMFGFQFKQDENGEPRILECNPRVQGTMVASVMAGANLIAWGVAEALGKKIDLSYVKIKWGMKFKRYWGGIGIFENKIIQLNPWENSQTPLPF